MEFVEPEAAGLTEESGEEVVTDEETDLGTDWETVPSPRFCDIPSQVHHMVAHLKAPGLTRTPEVTPNDTQQQLITPGHTENTWSSLVTHQVTRMIASKNTVPHLVKIENTWSDLIISGHEVLAALDESIAVRESEV